LSEWEGLGPKMPPEKL